MDYFSEKELVQSLIKSRTSCLQKVQYLEAKCDALEEENAD